MIVGRLVKASEAPPLSEQQVLERLADWSERLIERRDGSTNCVLTTLEITREIDRLLDELGVLLAVKSL
jgi:hypothetical protein